jgi:hypothetical protein
LFRTLPLARSSGALTLGGRHFLFVAIVAGAAVLFTGIDPVMVTSVV